MEVVLLAIGIVAIAFLLLGVNVIFRKVAFPETEVGKNKDMKNLGISCAKCDENRKFREAKKRYAAKHINPVNLSVDFGGVKK